MDPKLATLLQSLMDGASQSTGETGLRTPTLERIAATTGYVSSTVRNIGFRGVPRYDWSITVEGMKAILAAETSGEVEATPVERLRKWADLYWHWSTEEGAGAAVYASWSRQCAFAGDTMRCAHMGQVIDDHVEMLEAREAPPAPR